MTTKGSAVKTFLHKLGTLNALAAIVNQPSAFDDKKNRLLAYVLIYKQEEKEELKILCRPYLSEPQPSID